MVRKQLIIEKSLELFAEQGFEATSVQQITDRCGISKGAFYLSFKSKDELIMAIVDYFMIQVTTDIDQAVRLQVPKDKLLYEFYYSTFDSFNKHTGFAKLFVQEQALQLNQELLIKIDEFDRRINQSLLHLLDQVYTDLAKELRYDLLVSMKALLHNYIGLYMHRSMTTSPDLLVRSLVEKTDILARHMTIPFVSEETFRNKGIICKDENESEAREQLIKLIEQLLSELEEPIEVESLLTLKQSLLQPEPSLAIVKGMLENLRHNPACRWVCYLVREHYRL